jgi:hypothetical protein
MSPASPQNDDAAATPSDANQLLTVDGGSDGRQVTVTQSSVHGEKDSPQIIFKIYFLKHYFFSIKQNDNSYEHYVCPSVL